MTRQLRIPRADARDTIKIVVRLSSKDRRIVLQFIYMGQTSFTTQHALLVFVEMVLRQYKKYVVRSLDSERCAIISVKFE